MRRWTSVERLHEGAEAIVDAGVWLGRPGVRKHRRPRTWRHPDLDRRLTQARQVAEARMLRRLQAAGLPVPPLLDIDASDGTLVLGRLPGGPLAETLRSPPADVDVHRLLQDLGGLLRTLHRHGVVHGDLTTHNLLFSSDHGLAIIDFGLARISEETERFGLDLHVLHECLGASHPEHEGAMAAVEAGYRLAGSSERDTDLDSAGGRLPWADEVLERLDSIRTRVRYHT